MGLIRHDLASCSSRPPSGRGEPAAHTKATEPSPVTEDAVPAGTERSLLTG